MKTYFIGLRLGAFLVLVTLVGCTSQKAAMDDSVHSMTPATASSGDVAAIEAVVIGLFDGMRDRDADKIASLFAEGATMQSTSVQNGVPVVTDQRPASTFSDAVRNATGPQWDEKIWNLKIEVDNRLGSAWMDYAFYLGDDFSHCGANSFQLFKGEAGWKIIYLVDSRKRAGCEIPESAKPGVNG